MQYLDLNTTGILDTRTTQTTFCAWVFSENTEAPDANQPTENGRYVRDEVIFAQKDGGGTGRIYLYGRAEIPTGGGEPTFVYNNFLGGSQNRANAGSLRPGAWQHVAVVCNPVDQSVTYYINGERDSTVSTGAFEACTGSFRIGGHKAGKDYFRGYIDDVWFFKGILSADEVRQICEGTFDATVYYPDGSGDEPSAAEWPLKEQAYTIRNFSSTPAYMVDNGEADNRISCVASAGASACWIFEPTQNSHCYRVRNLQTGRYIQAYAKAAEQMVAMGNEGVEYYVAPQTSEGGRYGFACTAVTPHDFTSGTIGLNLRAESNQSNCYVQTYAAAAGTNHRSFWTLSAAPEDIVTALEPARRVSADGQTFDLLGRPWMRGSSGLRVSHGVKFLEK